MILSTLAATTTSMAAESPVKVSFGVSLQPARWQGENLNGGSEFDARASQLQLNLRIRKDKLYGGLSFQGAEFDFDDGAPNKVSDTAVAVDDNVTIDRGEFDLVVGYYLWPKVSLFVDLKSISNDWQGQSYATRYAGLGFGMTGYTPLNKDWLFFGSIGFVGLNIKSGGTDIGDGRGSALVLGFLYRITDNNNFTISLKSQHNEYDFDQGSEQEHDIGGLVFGFSHTL
jgi:hypothetical protein